MGQVFLGMSPGGRPIAVKVIRTELAEDPQFRAQFQQEVAAAQKVSGLFTALVVDADLDSPMPWLATAYVAGPSLTEAVRSHGPLPARTLLTLTAGLAEGLSAIHAAGVVHGDLKPSNVLLAEDGPRVIDFGISQAAGATAAGSDLRIGSPGFMSPEQVLGGELSPASDMFSLGAVLTFAATGQGPFGAGSTIALMYRVVNDHAEIGSVPADLRRLVGNCLAKHPGDRPTADELLAQVGAIQPADGWLAEAIMSGFTQDRSASGPSDPAGPDDADSLFGLTSSVSVQPLPARRNQPGRHRISRPLASAAVTGGLVAASAVAAFALVGADRPHSSANLQPQSGAGTVATAPASVPGPLASASPGSSAASSPRSSAAPAAPIAPNAFLTSTAPSPFSPSISPSVTPSISPSSRSPSSSPTVSKSPSPSPSTSSSASSSPSSSASSSTPPSSTPPPSSSTPPPPSSTPPPSSSTPPPSSSTPPPSSSTPPPSSSTPPPSSSTPPPSSTSASSTSPPASGR
jgi:serine/threonine protein kinase